MKPADSRIVRRHDLSPLSRTNTKAVRVALCDDFAGRCAYCLAHVESLGGGHFEIDHHRPRSNGGTHAYRNLYWSCRACNGFKRDKWPTAAEHRHGSRFSDPCAEWDIGVHYLEESTGHLIPITPCGGYHLAALGLNREELVSWRLARAATLARVRKARAALIKLQREKRDPSALASLGSAVEDLERSLSKLIPPIPAVATRARSKRTRTGRRPKSSTN